MNFGNKESEPVQDVLKMDNDKVLVQTDDNFYVIDTFKGVCKKVIMEKK